MIDESKTQMDWTKSQLLLNGRVSRNAALKIYFTRLGARIDDLKKEGWEIKGEWVKTDHGKDYIYKLISAPSEIGRITPQGLVKINLGIYQSNQGALL